MRERFTTSEGEKVFIEDRPEDNKERLRIEQLRDFKIAQALQRGAGAEEIRKISEMSPEELADKRGEVVDFPQKRKAA